MTDRLSPYSDPAMEPVSAWTVTAYCPVRPNGDLWIEGMSDQPQSVFSNVCAWEGFPKGGWRECEEMGWKVIGVKVKPL